MSLGQSPGIVTNGLVFAYDMGNPQKSWKGKPTVNHAYGQNARADSSYAPYVQTTSGTWPQHHPDAIRVYNYQGQEITGYVNGGVGDYTNTYHAIWTLDPILNKPVVTMRDVDGQWKAKSFGLSSGTTPNAMGVGYGDTYTISWLQWTDNIAKSANAGMYGQNTSGSNGFHDGLSNSFGTSYNTKPYTWQRVWATFTVSASRNLAAVWSCYMYGHYITRGTVKIADVQIETGSVSGFIENGESTRSNTQAIVDLTGQNTITATSLTYNSDGTFSFNGSSNFLVTPASGIITGNTITIEAWVKTNITGAYKKIFTNDNAAGIYLSIGPSPYNTYFGVVTSGGTSGGATWTSNISTTSYTHLVGTYNGSTCTLYVNGVQVAAGSASGNLVTGSNVYISGYQSGSERWNGNIPAIKVYNRALSAAEVQQNFNALRGRYGL